MCWSCCSSSGPKWKREIVRDHKFDYVDLDEFYDRSCFARLGYLWVYIMILKSTAVYLADLWTAISLLALDNQMYAEPVIPTETSKWIFLASIIVSYLLLFWDMVKTRKIIRSRNISFAFTSIIASRYYSIRKGYKYYCLFRKIDKQLDPIPFFVFFTLKGWKRLFLTESPRQVINIVTLVALVPKWIQIEKGGQVLLDNEALGKDLVQKIMTGTMAFSVVIFGISFLLVCLAFIMYVPLLCHIQGNLKEYCCHKVDKRIAELLRRQARKRTAKNQQQQAGRWDAHHQPPTITSNAVEAKNMIYSQPEYAQSDQLGLIAHAQVQPYSPTPSSTYSSPYYYHHNNNNNNYF
ncbi:hypothetical protein BDB00DRAFT_632482 [Zychaea mexicana]|uniref:uncharacterized protein n=1 Tax=Zychaea mexicana TaxID=64656 RepID=UPI0022FE82DF|nr:uncharacterized protein BDB00DRAFT_632482 [Zychaea mexicana]KAI9489215.1 hypothetical protein BDB00DRAFT_632482 [Zychaea mexicana]